MRYDSKYFAHGGPGSGRYPLGSGDNPYQHGKQKKFSKFFNKKNKKNDNNNSNNQNNKNDSEKIKALRNQIKELELQRKLDTLQKTDSYINAKDYNNISNAFKNTSSSLKYSSKDVNDLAYETRKYNDAKARRAVQQKNPAKEFSNRELSDLMTRMNLENSYNQLMADRAVARRGETYTEKMLRRGGTAIKVAGTAAGLAATIYAMRKMKLEVDALKDKM